MNKLLFVTCACLLFIQVFSQNNVIKGRVVNQFSEPLQRVTVILKGTNTGTITDNDGSFKLVTNKALPVTVIFTSVGFDPLEMNVNNYNNVVAVLSSKAVELDVTLAATRVRSPILRSPVTLGRIGQRTIQTGATTSPFDLLGTLPGVDFVTSGLIFKTPTTRGFNGSGSFRVNQWVDGMDNQAPGMNFAVGNFAGVNDLDLESIDLLPGASSALYGPGGMSGTILINSKNPFRSPGLSVLVKQGVMNVDGSQRPNATSYNDWSVRFAKVIGNKFAFKIGAQYIKATDWLANDSTNYDRVAGKVISGNRNSDPNYDGINVYGDETSGNIGPILGVPVLNVSRTGYNEKDFVDPTTKNLKLTAALHYRLRGSTEAILAGNYGTGTTVYTGSDRYALKNIKIGQYKLELRDSSWFIRGYTTQEDAGDSYATTTIARVFNEDWKPSGQWYGAYANAYATARPTASDDATAHALARAEADKGRPVPGSEQFNKIFNQLKTVPLSQGGGKFLDKTNLYMVEGQYNLSKLIQFAEVVVGGNYKQYVLNSQGTIFIDTAGKIRVNEFGAYMQVTKRLLNNKLTLAASGRLDKNDNFKGNLTPRISAVVEVAKNYYIRLSYQTAYRFPSNQQQFIKVQVASNIWLLGGLPWIVDYMAHKNGQVFRITPTGLKPYTYKQLKPETCKSYEVGYKALIQNKLLIDIYGYTSRFQDFLGRSNLIQPAPDRIYSIVENSEPKVKTQGFGLGLDYYITKSFMASSNFYSDKISNVPAGFVSNYNTPKYRFNLGFSSTGVGKQKKIGFGVQYKWQDSFLFENDFANGTVKAFSTIDAQVNYKILKNTEIRIGGTNLLNHYYKNGFGNPEIGGLYYASLRLDIK
jgi:outer membrane receptor protein involved in Fe transport